MKTGHRGSPQIYPTVKDRERAKWKRRVQRDPEKAKKRYRDYWRRLSPERRREKCKRGAEAVRRWRQRNPELDFLQRKAWHTRKRYGLSIDDVVRMNHQQGGLCARCGRPPKVGKTLFIDHDHKTGMVRGLLCPVCNNILGLQGDTEQSVREGMYLSLAYLRRAKMAVAL